MSTYNLPLRLQAPKSEKTLSAICAEAEKLGMSYGKYVDYAEQEKKKNKKRPARKQAKK